MRGKNKFLAVIAIASAVLVGCETPRAHFSSQKFNLEELNNSINKVIGEPRHISQNGRVFTSGYEDKMGRLDQSLVTNGKDRRFTVISIQGDRRPYQIEVETFVERKVDGQYGVIGEDEPLADDMAKRLQRALIESQDKRNIIDDFKAF